MTCDRKPNTKIGDCVNPIIFGIDYIGSGPRTITNKIYGWNLNPHLNPHKTDTIGVEK